MKPPRKPEAALCFLRPYFRLFEDLLPRREPMLSRNGNGEGVRPEGRTPFQFNSLGATHTRPL